MLEKLNTIEWGNLQHAYGNASDVPDLIRALASNDSGKRQQAYWDLGSNITHQGSVYEAASYAVPFFIELLQNENIQDKNNILELLSGLARGQSWHYSHQGVDFLFRNEHNKPEFQETIRREIDHVKLTYDSVVQGYPIYLLLLTHYDDEVREASAKALSNCGEYAQLIEPQIQHLITSETELKIRKSYVLSLKYLWQHPDFYTYSKKLTEEQIQYFLELLRNSNLHVLRYASALALSEMTDNELVNEILVLFDEITELTTSEREAIDYNIHDMMYDIRLSHPKLAYKFLKKHLLHSDMELQIRMLYQFEYFGTTLREHTGEIVDFVAQLLQSPHEKIRIRTAQTLGIMGIFAKSHLVDIEAILGDKGVVGHTGTKRALEEVKENRWYVQDLLQSVTVLDESPTQLTQSLLEIAESTDRRAQFRLANDARNIVYTLSYHGVKAKVAIPALIRTMNESFNDVTRVHAARAIFAIAPLENHEIVLEALIKELRPRPVSILAVNSLGQMGYYAKSVVDTLRKIAELDYRFMRHSEVNTVNVDEALQHELNTAIVTIESSSG